MEGFILNASDIGGWGLFVALGLYVVFAVVKGHLMPRSVVEELRDRFNEVVTLERERSESYRESSENYQELVSSMTEAQVQSSQQQIESNTKILQALQKAGEGSIDA